jgi:L,D-transpeptidase-like protein
VRGWRPDLWRWVAIGVLSVAVLNGNLPPALASRSQPSPAFSSWESGRGDWELPRYPSLFPPAPSAGAPERRIVVDLSEQQLIAFEGDSPVRAFPVSTGDAAHPTIVGRFAVQRKYEHIDLIGVDYYYHDVPNVIAFAPPFYIHAAPWRAEFGVPASRGCVTLAPADAAWLFAWAQVGTAVVIRW